MKIFISYGHDDHSDLAERIAKDLQKKGYDIWIDMEGIKISDSWETEIENGIKSSNWLIVLMTYHSMRRPDGYCLDEISYARYFSKPIMPIKIQNIAPPISIVRLQWIDMSDYLDKEGKIKETYYAQKLDDIEKIISGIRKFEDLPDPNNSLLEYLNPLDNESYLIQHKKNFYGRKWLFELYNDWLHFNQKSRILCIIGQAGSGKTAFVSKLCEYSDNVVAIHFCKYNNDERANPKRAIMSLAFHLSTQIPKYNNELGFLSDLPKLLDKSVNRLFEYIFIEPLSKIKSFEKNIVIIIDALDEATKDLKNDLVNLIIADFHKTPSWLKLVVTTRPEQDIERSLKHLNPIIIDNNSKENIDDIRGFIELNLKNELKNYENQEHIILKLIEKSQGNFLYTSEIIRSVKNNELDLYNIESFPDGLVNIYSNYFQRLFSGEKIPYNYNKEIRPLMEILSSNFEPLHIEIISDILSWDDYYTDDIKDYIYVLFPSNTENIEPIHKSLIDWLLDKSLSGMYRVSAIMAHQRLKTYFYKKYESGEMLPYITKYITKHILKSKDYIDAVKTLSNKDLQNNRIKLIGQDSAIREYLNEIEELFHISKDLVQSIFISDTFQNIFEKNRRYFYNAGLYFQLKDIGFDNIIEKYINSDSIETLVGCVNYLYIIEKYVESSNIALKIVEKYNCEKYYSALCELHNEIALTYRKIVKFDDCVKHSLIVCEIGSEVNDYYEMALANQTIGKVKYHRMEWEDAYGFLSKSVQLLKESLSTTNDTDYSVMLKLYIAAFEREVALSSVWRNEIDLAYQHLDNASKIYEELISRDRYYIRYLYVKMFAKIINGEYQYAIEVYPEILEIAKSMYDKSQVEFYYSLGLYFSNSKKDKILHHINLAHKYVNEIDAFIEHNEIIMFKNFLVNKKKIKNCELVNSNNNRDIENWIDYVFKFINNIKKGEQNVI